MNQPTLVVVAGLPLSGKTTLSRVLAPALKMHGCDVDNVLKLAFGILDEEQYTNRWKNPEEAAKITQREMRMGYILLHQIVELSLEAQRSLLICATYSRKSSQEFLREIIRKQNARLRIIVCDLKNDTKQEIEKRLNREDNRGMVYGAKSFAHYEVDRSRFESPATSGIFAEEETLVLDTSAPITNIRPIVNFVSK